MGHKWKVGQTVFVVRENDGNGNSATITRVGRKFGLVKSGEFGVPIEFVLETGRERDETGFAFANNRGHVLYVTKEDYDEELRRSDAVRRLAGIFGVSEYSIRYPELSPECIDDLLAVIEKHEAKNG